MKERFFWMLAVFILFAALIITNVQSARKGAQYADYIKGVDTTVIRWRDSAGNHAKTAVQTVPAGVFKNSNDSTIKRLRDSLKRAENLLAHAHFTATTGGTVRAPVTRLPEDTCIGLARVFNYSDKWLEMRGVIDSELNLTYRVNNPLSITYKWERPRWYKKKDLRVQIDAENPNTGVGRISTVVIQSPPKRWYETRAAALSFGFVAGAVTHALVK